MDIEDLRVDANPTLVREHALSKLRSAIGSGLYPPGKRLVERELCEVLGVSRTSVREALRQLQAEGLIEAGGAAQHYRRPRQPGRCARHL